MPDNKSISVARNSDWKEHRGCLAVFFSIFLLFGVGFTYGFFIRPILLVQKAKGWKQVPCTVVSSEVKRRRGSDSTTYRVHIVYRYEVDGRMFESDRYHFTVGSSSGRAGKQRIVKQYPPGKETHCYVDPRDPTQAVINRDFTSDMLFGLFPLVFVAVGGGGLAWTFWKGPAGEVQDLAPPGKSAPSADVWPVQPARGGAIELKSKQSPLAKFIGILLLALFWNGIVSVFLIQAIQNHQQGRPDWFLNVFLTPFLLGGTALVGGVGYTFLGLFSPRPTLTLLTDRVALGDTVTLTWRFTHNSGSIRRLKIQLEGKEEAKHRMGTKTHTDTETFLDRTLVETTDEFEIARGRTEFTIPADSMHTFEADNNKIYWDLHLSGDIAWWPDLNETYPIVVLPRNVRGRR